MQPAAASRSRSCQRRDWEKARAERSPPGAAWKSSTATGDGDAARMSQAASQEVRSRGVDGRDVAAQQAGPVQFAEQGGDAAGPVDVLDQIVAVRGDLAQARDRPGHGVDVGQAEVEFGLVGRGQQMEHGVGRAAHGDVQAHRVLERRPGGDPPRQHRLVVLVVVAVRQRDDGPAGVLVQLSAGGVRGQRGAVAGEGQAEGLGQAVHRVGREHARAGAAGRAGLLLQPGQVGVGDGGGGGVGDHRDQVQAGPHGPVDQPGAAALHRSAGDEHGREVESQRGHQHPGRDLVAVGDADQGVGAVGLDHVFDRVGDQVAGRQRIQHPVVAHRDAVVDGDRVELPRHSAGGGDRLADDPPDRLQMGVARHELGEAVGDGDDRFAEVGGGDTGGAEQGAGAGHVAAMRDGTGAESGHGTISASAPVPREDAATPSSDSTTPR